MLIGDLPQDVTPSVDGTVPYSEDGIHLNFIKIQDLLGLGGGGDGGGGGDFLTVEFPDSSIGNYIDEQTHYLTQGFKNTNYTGQQIHNFPASFFSECIVPGGIDGWINSDNYVGGDPTFKLLDVDDITYNSSSSVTITWRETNKNFGLDVADGLASCISENFPYFIASGYETIANWDHNPASSVSDAAVPEISDIKMPVLYMLYSKHLEEKIDEDYHAGIIEVPDTRNFAVHYDTPTTEWRETEYMEEPMRLYSYATSIPGVTLSEGVFVNQTWNGVDLKLARTKNLINVFANHTCDYDDPEYDHTTNYYSVAKAVINNIDSEFYEGQTGNNIQLWDRYYINYPSGYGETNVLCHHVIDINGEEWWIFNRGDGQGPGGHQSYNFSHFEDGELVPGGVCLCPTLFDREIQIPWARHPLISLNNGSASFTSDVNCFSDLINVIGYPGDEYSVYNMIDDLNLGEGHVIIYDTEDAAESAAMTIAFGLSPRPFKSLVLTSDHTISLISPIKKKKLWNWDRTNITDTSIYKDDGLYGGADLAKYAAFSVVAPNITGSSVKPAISNCMTFGVDAHSTVPYTLGNYTNGGGGGGSDLPDVDISDEGKVLTVNSSGNWDDLYPEPFKLAGNIDSQTAIDVENYLSVRGGIRGDKVGNVASIYADPSVMHIGNYVDISSAKTGGFSVSKTEDANTGVTTMALDISDIDKFQQLVAGNAISISKSIDSNNVRTYTISGTPLTAYLNHAFKNHRHIPDSTWVTLNTYASSGDYHPSPMQFDAESMYYVDVTVSLEVPANIASGSYVKLILSPYGDEPNEHHTQAELATEVFGSTNGSGSETTNISRSSVLEDTRLLIPGVTNTVRFAGFIAFGALTVNRDLFINIFQNTGLTLGYDAANPGSPASTLGIKTTGYYFKF